MNAKHQVAGGGFGVPMYMWPIVAVVLIGAGAYVWGAVTGQERVWVPKADIPAGQRVLRSQFEARDIWARGLPEDAFKPPSVLEGRVTKQALVAGRPVASDALTKPVPALATVLKLTPAKVSAVGVAAGDGVRLRFAPTGGDPDLHTVSVFALLLRAPTAEKTEFAVSVAPADVDAVLDVAGRADVFLTPR
jgi:hypothetical protein